MTQVYKDIIRLTIDLKTGVKEAIAPIKQADNLSRVLRCQLVNNGKPINLKGSQLLLYVVKADYKQCVINGVINESKTGIVDFELTEQSLILAEEIQCEIVKIDEGDVLLSFPIFKIGIDGALYDNGLVESTNEFSALAALISNVAGWENRFVGECERIEKEFDGKISKVNAQLSQKISYGEGGVITNTMLSQEVKEAMTGGSVAVVGKNTILSSNIVNGQVKRNKTDFYTYSLDANLANDVTIIDGVYYNNEGTRIETEGVCHIRINKSDIDFSVTPIAFNMVSYISYWNSQNSFISGYIEGNAYPAYPKDLGNIPSEASYVIIGFFTESLPTAVVSKKSVFSNNLSPIYYDNLLKVNTDNLVGKLPLSSIKELNLNPNGNLIDKSTLLVDKYYNTSGELVSAANAYSFEAVINPTESYKFNFDSHITFWDENDSFINGYIQGSLVIGGNTALLAIPQNAKKVRMLIFGEQLDLAIFALEKYYSKNLKTSYTISGLISDTENANNTQIINPLYGKKVVFFGDSWCAGNTSAPDGWCGIIKANNPSMTAINCGRHGADWNQCYLHILSNEEIMKTIVDSDYVIVEAYTNGLYSEVDKISKELGEVNEYAYYQTLEEIEALDDSYAKDLERVLYIIASTWHGKKIGLMFPYKAVDHLKENNAFRKFRGEVVKCANKYNIPIFDNFNGCNIPSWNEKLRVQYFMENDTVHLNKKGYEVITPAIESWMKTL